jgi:hypothetical protein
LGIVTPEGKDGLSATGVEGVAGYRAG